MAVKASKSEKNQKFDKNLGSKMGPEWVQNGSKMGPKWVQNGFRGGKRNC